MISLRVHAVFDYIIGALLLLAPFVFGFSDLEVARNVFIFAGALLIIYSLFTNYEYAAVRAIPLGLHMSFDVILGVFLMLAPWTMNYRIFLTSGQEYLHYVLGIGVFALVGLTREKTEADKVEHGIQIKAHQPLAGRL